MNWKELFSLNNVALLGVATYLLSTIRGWLLSLFVFIKRRFIMGVSVSGSYMEDRVRDWLINNCYSKSSKTLLMNNNMYLYNEFNKSLMWGNYLIRVRRFCWAYVYSFQIKDSFSNDGTKNMLGVDIYGIGRTDIIADLKASFETKNESDDMLRLVTKGSSRFSSIFVTKEPRTYKKIFGGFLNKVENVVDNFVKNKDIYDKFGRKYKTAILLYGPPGTGKTSIIKHLANKLNIESIYFINELMSGENSASVMAGEVNDSTIDHCDKHGNSCPAICVIEDIDKSVLGISDSLNDDNRINNVDNQMSRNGYIVDKLMQFLDSSISPNNMLLIITTNNIDLLPKPLLRSGRIDHKIYVGPLNKKEAQEMINYYGFDDDVTDLFEDEEEFNPADLENILFKALMSGKPLEK